MFRLILVIALAFSAQLSLADSSTEPSAFQAAYAGYQKAIEGGNKKARLNSARLSLETALAELGADYPGIPELRYNYGYELLDSKQQKEAAKVLKVALQEYEKKYGESSEELIPLLIDYGNAKAVLYDGRSMQREYRRAKKLLGKKYGEKSIEFANALMRMGTNFTERTKTSYGRRYLQESKEILAEIDPNSISYAFAAFYAGKLYLGMKNHRKAIAEFEEALPIFEAATDNDNRMELATRAFMVEALESMGEREKATAHCVAIGRMTPEQDNQDYTPLFKRPPAYPWQMQRRGLEGKVLVEFSVDEEGFVRNGIVVDATGGKQFEAAALDVIKTWRYAPRFIEGKPVRTDGVQNIINFELSD